VASRHSLGGLDGAAANHDGLALPARRYLRMFERMGTAFMYVPVAFFDVKMIERILTHYSGNVTLVGPNVSPTFGASFSNFFSAESTLVVAAVVIQQKQRLLAPGRVPGGHI
jgi:hypothetical protein